MGANIAGPAAGGAAAECKPAATAAAPSPPLSPVNVVLDEIGAGWFQVILTLYTGLYWVADAAETTTMTYLSSSVRCYWGVTSAQASLISSIAFIGQIVGFYMCGSLGDLFGRQKVLIASAFWLVVFSIASAAAPTFEWMVFFRMCVGMGMGSMPLTYTLLTECLPTRNRGIFLTVVHGFWGVGAMLCAGLAWAVMPHWGFRWLLALTALPAVVILCCCWFVPESPYWLHVKGRVDEAEAVLRRIARVNRFRGEITFNKTPPSDLESSAHGLKAEVSKFKKKGGADKVAGPSVVLAPAPQELGGSGKSSCSSEGAATEAGSVAPAAAAAVVANIMVHAAATAEVAPLATAAPAAKAPTSPFERASSANSLQWRGSASMVRAAAGEDPLPESLSTAASQITVTWSQRGQRVRSLELRQSQQVQLLSRWQRGVALIQRWWRHTVYDFRLMFTPRGGRLKVSLVMIMIWFIAQTSSYGTTQTVTNLQTQGAGGLVCSDGKPVIASSKYRDVFTATAADIIAILFLVLLIEGRLGRKWLFMTTLTCWGTWMFVLTAGLGHNAQEAFIWLARGFNSASIVVMNVMTPEMFPTSLRGFAVGLIESISRLGGFISPYIVNAFHDSRNDNGCLWLFGGLTFAAAAAALLVKDHTGKPLEDYDEWDQEDIK